MEKIQQGLGAQDRLTNEEREVLLTPMGSASVSSSFSRAESEALQNKCARGLSRAYENDMRDKNLSVGLKWRDYNEHLYKDSERVVSGVVQGWYLSEGRGMEKRAFAWEKQRSGCMPTILLVGFGVLVLAALSVGSFALATRAIGR